MKRKLKTIEWIVFIELCILLVFAFIDDIHKGAVLCVAKIGCLLILLILNPINAKNKKAENEEKEEKGAS